MDAKTHILIHGKEIVDAAETSTLNIAPGNTPEWGVSCDKLLFDIYVLAVRGAPTAWSLLAKFQRLLPSTDGMQYQYPVWVDLQTATLAYNIAEGKGWFGGAHADPVAGSGIVADQTDTLPLTVSRTIQNFGLSARVVLTPAFTGGTTPSLSIAVLATELRG